MSTKSQRIWVIIPKDNPGGTQTTGSKKILMEKHGLTWREAYQKTFPQEKDGNLFVETTPETYTRKNK